MKPLLPLPSVPTDEDIAVWLRIDRRLPTMATLHVFYACSDRRDSEIMRTAAQKPHCVAMLTMGPHGERDLIDFRGEPLKYPRAVI